jgi:hypothetical protein
VKDKIFAQYEDNHHGSGKCIELQAPDGLRRCWWRRRKRFFVPKYVGHKGWIGIRMEGPWREHVVELLRDSYRMMRRSGCWRSSMRAGR